MGLRDYAIVTAGYWGFTLTDGALRMLVLLHLHTLGYTPFQLAFMFVLYEACGVVTNLFGGWIAATFGLRPTLYAGLGLQIFALTALSMLNPEWSVALSVAFVVAAQGLAGIAKDLTKMSSKSAIKLIVRDGAQGDGPGRLFRWVAILTGSKNALKGAGFFLGGVLLTTVGFSGGLLAMAAALSVVLIATAVLLKGDLGRSKAKIPFSRLFAKSRAINLLSGARVFLFGARDIWFVVGVPIYFYDRLGWSFTEVSGFLALWVIGYGAIQAWAPSFIRRSPDGLTTEIPAARLWAFVLAAIPLLLAAAIVAPGIPATASGPIIVVGLLAFGVAFAINSSLHSYLILAYTDRDSVALNVGFYYMANAAGRLIGTLLSGLVYQTAGLGGCLVVAGLFVIASGLIALRLPTAPDPDIEHPEYQAG